MLEAEGTVAPGIVYIGDTFQLDIEASVSTTRASGIGITAQSHFFFSDIFPDTLGKPLF
jgi:hypothetical protein